MYFRNRVQDFWHGIRLGKKNIDDLILASRELVNLSEDLDLLAEMKEWRGTEQKVELHPRRVTMVMRGTMSEMHLGIKTHSRAQRSWKLTET